MKMFNNLDHFANIVQDLPFKEKPNYSKLKKTLQKCEDLAKQFEGVLGSLEEDGFMPQVTQKATSSLADLRLDQSTQATNSDELQGAEQVSQPLNGDIEV